jgi:predicted nucleotide-binding protein (sugar kinase/HSP70/actin superfamily)
MKLLINSLEDIKSKYSNLALKEPLHSRPLIGVVGEIFLRFNRYGNQDILKRIESLGAETWIANIGEWVWYTNIEEKRKLREAGKKFSISMLKAKLRHSIQHWEEKRLHKPFEEIFSKRPEANIETILKYSKPYLPYNMAHGEMTLNAGKAIDFYQSGCDGIIDISPFTCMNGIVTEVIYPQLSKNHYNIPIRIFYFDGVSIDLDRDLEIFMEQVKNYNKRKQK